ncbi:MAG: TetR/AcrR family transcriptional regulator [Terracidiphilus sp.]|jgi:AcrR family transcriptional regulator
MEDVEKQRDLDRLQQSCLAAFIQAGTLDLSLDRVAVTVGISKRMLIHYFGSRDALEAQVLTLFEDWLRQWLVGPGLPAGATLASAIPVLWDQLTAPDSRSVLLLIMDIHRRGWQGSEHAKAFSLSQQRFWHELLTQLLPDTQAVEELLDLFRGAILTYLVTGDRDQGSRSLQRMIQRFANIGRSRWRIIR